VAQALEAQTEGWAAALQLAALALPPGEAALPLPPAAQRHVFDYLAAEVLGRQPPAVQRFLLHTSILDRLSADLCADLVADAPAGLLAQLEQHNLFLTPLDGERRWYRYHQLFAEFLRAQLAASGADQPALHARAAAWLEAHGDRLPPSTTGWPRPTTRAIALIDRSSRRSWRRGLSPPSPAGWPRCCPHMCRLAPAVHLAGLVPHAHLPA
jgi:LuxR family maltose regulon positive regulatory protein